MSRPLCILLPEIGVISETFLRWDACELLPRGTVVIADPPPGGASIRQRPAWDTDGRPTLALTPIPGDPPPSPERMAAVADFLTEHRVEVVLVEYLDFADRWLDVLLKQGVRVWLRGHGVDFSARLREQRWREVYRRYDRVDGIVVPSHVAAEALVALGLPSEKIHVVRYSVDLPTIADVSRTNSSGEVRCVAVGRLVPKKAPLLLLESFRRAATRNPAIVLDLVGNGPLMTDVRRYVDEHVLVRQPPLAV
ncbi:glycosyltransferase [Micromonospora sp. CP22]|uniref:glycosyltransferase n=1 Tax=Micromonospora sp. CP22 TaxID=2580517 RepID=UPI00132B945C|nr:glycosyltransferase [Micromonospora sp. CP22]MTK05434.1 glycosyltransferase [Micromonospora sp. CP22]